MEFASSRNSAIIPTESWEQSTLFEWAMVMQGKYPDLKWMYHVPNEGKRSKAVGAQMRREGLKPGVPDVVLPVARGGYHGLYIEMKRIKGSKTTEDQKEWLAGLAEQGYMTKLCKGWEEAADTIEKYLNL